MKETAPAGASDVIAVALLATQYALSPPTAATDASDCTFSTLIESVTGAAYDAVVVQSCKNWYCPPFVALFQPVALIQPRLL